MDIVERFKLFFKSLKPGNLDKMVEEQKKSKKEVGYKESSINILIASVISAIITVITYFTIQPAAQKKVFEVIQQTGTPEQIEQLKQLMAQQTTIQQSINIETIVLSQVLQIVLFLVYFLVLQVLMYYVSSFLGGKGTLKKQTYLFSNLYAGLFLLLAIFPPIILITAIISPLVVIVPVILYYIALAYGLYLTYKLEKSIHELDMLKTGLAVIIAVTVVFWISTVMGSLTV